MEEPFIIDIPMPKGQKKIEIKPGFSAVFIGPNGSGKTRLAMHIERELGEKAHRISAHRALALNPSISKISEGAALRGLRHGHTGHNAEVAHRDSNRWGGRAATHLLNDFEFVVQALFANQSNIAVETHNRASEGDCENIIKTKFQLLVDVLGRLMPHLKLHVTGDDILVSVIGDKESESFSAQEMSDGERAVFYMVGQVLVAAKDTLIVFDEPELHVHRSIMTKLWDELEALRKDCAFLFITHDLEFASYRVATKYVIKRYNPKPFWNIKELPMDTGFDEELITLILGSRKPILFVEGDHKSLDNIIYRSCFPNFTIVPQGGCQDVIHTVCAMRKHHSLVKINCSGIVDGDNRTQAEIKSLQEKGIFSLPVAVIENILLLPSVISVILEYEGFKGEEIERKLDEIANKIFKSLDQKIIDQMIIINSKRYLDGLVKKMKFGRAQSLDNFNNLIQEEIEKLKQADFTTQARDNLDQVIKDQNLLGLLEICSMKGFILSSAAKALRGNKQEDFKEWLARALCNETVPGLIKTIQKELPKIAI